ncbi:MAG: trypsin-like peptidase domain-containing protein, partial [Acidobacteriota bacterium]
MRATARHALKSWAGVGLLMSGWASAQGVDVEPLAGKVRSSVVEILGTVEGTDDTAYGTGFVFREKGLVVTNAHVVHGVREPMVRTVDGALLASVQVLYQHEEIDLAVLRVTGLGADPLPLAAGPPPAVGTPVVAIGHPRGYEFTVSTGIVSAHRSLDAGGPELIQITAPISPGSSGGPLLDGEGRVVGVCSLTLTEGQNINFAVPAAEIGPVIDQALSIEASLGGAGTSSLPPETLARLAREQRESGELVRAAEMVRRALERH